MVEMYVSDSLYLNAEVLDEKHWMIHLSNGAEIPVEKDPEHYGSRWGWKIGNQIFSDDKTALWYLERLVTEKLTGMTGMALPHTLIHSTKIFIRRCNHVFEKGNAGAD